MKNLKPDQWVLFLPVCCGLFIYITWRAFHLSFTHDEGISYNVITAKNYLEYAANNHLLNTWLMALSASVFGHAELALRLPNVLAFSIYLLFCYRLIQASTQNLLAFFAIALLFLNPFVLDFFSLARGYGLSLAFMVTGLWFFLRKNYVQLSGEDFLRNSGYAMGYATLALLSNLALINFYIALLVLFSVQYLLLARKEQGRRLRKHLPFVGFVFLTCIPLILGLKRLLILSQAGDLYVGAPSIDDSISSFIERSSYHRPYPVWFSELVQTSIKFVFVTGMVLALFRKKFNGPLFKLGALMVVILIGLYLEHYLFSTLFPMGRTGIYFIPLFGLFVYYFFVEILSGLKPKLNTGITVAGLLLIPLPLSIHFFCTVNTDHTFEWKYETHTREVVLDIEDKNKKAELGHNWIFGPAINYYVRSRNLNLVPVKLEEGKKRNQDFIYEFEDQWKGEPWQIVHRYDDIGSALYKNPAKEKTK